MRRSSERKAIDFDMRAIQANGLALVKPSRYLAANTGGTRMERRFVKVEKRLGPKMSRAWQELDQVTIAAIEGHCIGGGAALVVSLDFRFCGRSAHFRIPEVELGMNMSWGSIPRMVALMGPARTKQAVILSSDRIPATEALEWGLIEKVVDDGQALPAAMAF